MAFSGFWLDLPVLGGFCHKGTRAQSFDSSLLLGLPAFEKRLKAGFFFVFPGSYENNIAGSLLLSSGKRLSSSGNSSPSPDSSGNHFVRRGGQKIVADSGK